MAAIQKEYELLFLPLSNMYLLDFFAFILIQMALFLCVKSQEIYLCFSSWSTTNLFDSFPHLPQNPRVKYQRAQCST